MAACWVTICTLQAAWVWGLARRGEWRWCLVKFVVFVFKMFFMSAVMLLIENVFIRCIPRILLTNVRLTTWALYFCRSSLATRQIRLHSLIGPTDVKQTSQSINQSTPASSSPRCEFRLNRWWTIRASLERVSLTACPGVRYWHLPPLVCRPSYEYLPLSIRP